MSYASVTGVQRLAVNTAANKLAKATQRAREGLNPSGVVNDLPVDTLAQSMADALAVIGATGTLPDDQVVVADAESVSVQNSAATVTKSATADVTGGALVSVKLAATVALVDNGVKVNAGTVTGTGNFATFTVANGVITGITLSAS